MQIIWEKEIDADKIKVSPRPVWKCRTCEFYNKRPSCPPYVPNWKEAKEWINSYKKAILIKFEVGMENFEEEKRKALLYLLKRENELFKKHPYAFALFPGACNLCEECEFEKNGYCPMKEKVRPSIDAIGIEISSIADIKFDESVIYGLIMVE